MQHSQSVHPGARARVVATAQLIAVAAALGAWVTLASLTTWIPRVDGAGGTVLHVVLTGAVATLAVLIATWGDGSRRASLGLLRAPWLPSIGWGLLGVIACYVATTAAVLVYLIVSQLADGGPEVSLALALPEGALGRELASKARWASVFAEIPLAVAMPIALFAGIYEEIVFRGFFLGRLRVALGDTEPRIAWRWRLVAAIVISAALFAAGHAYQGLMGVVQTFAAGLALAAIAVWRRTIWSSIVTHATVDALGLLLLHFLKPLLQRFVEHGGDVGSFE